MRYFVYERTSGRIVGEYTDFQFNLPSDLAVIAKDIPAFSGGSLFVSGNDLLPYRHDQKKNGLLFALSAINCW